MKRSAAVAALTDLHAEVKAGVKVIETQFHYAEGEVHGVELAIERVKSLDATTEHAPEQSGEKGKER